MADTAGLGQSIYDCIIASDTNTFSDVSVAGEGVVDLNGVAVPLGAPIITDTDGEVACLAKATAEIAADAGTGYNDVAYEAGDTLINIPGLAGPICIPSKDIAAADLIFQPGETYPEGAPDIILSDGSVLTGGNPVPAGELVMFDGDEAACLTKGSGSTPVNTIFIEGEDTPAEMQAVTLPDGTLVNPGDPVPAGWNFSVDPVDGQVLPSKIKQLANVLCEGGATTYLWCDGSRTCVTEEDKTEVIQINDGALAPIVVGAPTGLQGSASRNFTPGKAGTSYQIFGEFTGVFERTGGLNPETTGFGVEIESWWSIDGGVTQNLFLSGGRDVFILQQDGDDPIRTLGEPSHTNFGLIEKQIDPFTLTYGMNLVNNDVLQGQLELNAAHLHIYWRESCCRHFAADGTETDENGNPL